MIDDIVFDIEMIFELPTSEAGGNIKSLSMDGSSFDSKSGEKTVISIS